MSRHILLILITLALSAGSPACNDASEPDDHSIVWFHADPNGAAAEPYADSTLAVFTSFNDMRVVALDSRTGTLAWQQRLKLAAGAPYAGMPFGSNLGAYANLIIVPAWDVYALDRTTGQVRWSFTRPDDFPGYGSVVVAGGTVYSVGRDLYALNAADGALRFRVNLGERPFRPVVVDSVIYVGTRREVLPGIMGNGHVMALDARTGSVLWSTPIDDPQDSVRGGSVGPVAVVDTLVVAAGMNGVVYALDRATGQERWTYTGAGSYSAGLGVLGQTVIVAGDAGNVAGIDVPTGQRRWQTGPGSSVLERITLGNDVALVSVGALFAFDAAGQVRWQHGGAGWGGPVYSTAATYRDGVVFIGSVSPEAEGPGFYAVRVP